MSSRNEHARAQAQVRLQQQTTITDDPSLLPLQVCYRSRSETPRPIRD
jgi:hypothetical protein